MRRTESLVAVAAALMTAPSESHYGYQLSRDSGVPSGVLYPILKRMLEDGWLSDGWEEIDPQAEKRPPRRYYRLTERGVKELGSLSTAAKRVPVPGYRLGLT